MTFTAAQELATQRGIEVVQAGTTVDPTKPPGTVLAQDPPAGADVAEGDVVELTVAVGPETVAVPELLRKTTQEAFQLLFTAGLTPGLVTEVFDPIVPVGQIVRQEPLPGVLVNKGTR